MSWSLLTVGLNFLKGLPWQVYAALAAVAALWMGMNAHGDAVRDARQQALREGAAATIALVNERQAAADRAARIALAGAAAAQDKISKETSDDLYETHDRIDARAAALRLRHDAKVAARQRAGGSGAMLTAGQAPSEPCPPPPGDGLPWSVALPLMQQAARDLAQLNALIDFEEAQGQLSAPPRAMPEPGAGWGEPFNEGLDIANP